MAHEAAFILDQLMGRNRDVVPGEGNENDRNWSDPDVCKYHLCGFCPSELFTNTRSDVGPCDKIHDPLLKKSYEESDRKGKMGYEDDFLEYLESLIRDLDRRIQRGKNRLQLSVSANVKAMGMDVGLLNSERMKELAGQINELVMRSEELGNLGHIDEAQELIREVDRLDREKERERSSLLLKANVPHTVAGYEMDPGNFHEKMEMCDLCGCFLVIGDSQSRIDAHLMGKQHMGFSRIRNTIAELKSKRREESVKRREERIRRSNRSISPRSSRDRARDREYRGHRRSRSGSRERSRRRERSGRSRSRSRDRRRRSRSREHGNRPRGRRSRSRDRRSRSRERRDRSRERRDRSRERRDRSRERRKKRDRSRDRSREHRDRSREHRDRSREHREHRDHRNRSRERRRKSRSRSRDRRHSRSRSRERQRSWSQERRHKQSQEPNQSKSKDRHHSESKDHHHGPSRERLSSGEHKDAARNHSSEREHQSSAEDEENGGKLVDHKDSSNHRGKSDEQSSSEDAPGSHCSAVENGCKEAINTPEGATCDSLNHTTSSVPECSEEDAFNSA